MVRDSVFRERAERMKAGQVSPALVWRALVERSRSLWELTT